ncbi:DUF3500 domain-containing protein [Fimbriiglobus ruber]|uniref:DUF3500 domain-containing protein n=1 Tax=Fimbriiglobus ruber TaxID=1908690 RepID=A0A225E4F3_9BACT|nr:DUF3500 domain-containing protein [Fimbriiglobus ruber]OWK43287.1 hypothetical protein FRUB_02886 [Fimbriiglobus ruber]
MTRSPILRFALVATTVAALTGVALVARQAQPTGAALANAANKFLATLTPEQKKKAAFGFDSPQREAWFFTPQQDKEKQFTRKGVRLEELNAEQRAAAIDLLKAGLSAKGFTQATTIMSLENILAELEGTKGAMTRNPNWYFVSIFGEPSNTGPWGWRFEGHHMSVNCTLDKGEVVSATPVVFGSNPADVRDGPQKGLRPLPETEDAAKELINSLDADQSKVARQEKQFPEIQEGKPNSGAGSPVGIPAAKLTDSQKVILNKLIEGYANRLPADLAKAELQRVKEAGPDKVFFGYCIEESKKGKPYSYRVQGPTFVIEFLNVQADSAGNPANHIHSAWRRLTGDFVVKQ